MASTPDASGSKSSGSKSSTAQEGISVLKQTFSEFSDDDCTTMAAALAYFTVFSLPPLLLILITLAGIFLTPQEVQQAIEGQAQNLVGAEGASQIQEMVQSANESVSGSGGTFALIFSIAGLVFGATGAFAQLQQALNRAWEVEPDPEQGGLWNFVTKRVLSLGMVLGIAFLLLVSLALSAALSAMGGFISGLVPGGLSDAALWAINAGISLLVITLLFAAIFKVMPDAEVAWKDVAVGALATALLFVIGKFLIGLYLGQSDPGAAFGAAGSLALILVWIYYSSMIVFLGAEFTQVWASRYGSGIEPDEDAVRVVEDTKHVRGEEQQKGEAAS